ncbi:MAG: serine hydrolase, partial [Desulfovibrio sp.]|nr:serine hydrolase [Desulfovibrio sp.]
MKRVLFFLLVFCSFAFSENVWAVHLPVKAAILYNMTNGKILFQQNPTMRIPPASLTKVMTLCIALDDVKKGKISLKKKVTISKLAANTKGSSMHLKRGERVSFSKLLVGTAVASGNDAATAVAQAVQPNLKKFVALM